jgi:hypothetical protein
MGARNAPKINEIYSSRTKEAIISQPEEGKVKNCFVECNAVKIEKNLIKTVPVVRSAFFLQ